MSALAEQARAKAKAKVARMVAPNKGSVDASGWTEPTDELGDVQTGPRPVSRRQFKAGGKVAAMHAGRKPRKSGGSLTADSLINRDVKEANEERAGSKHIGGMKRGGRAHKEMGGLALPAWNNPVSRASGGRTHGKGCDCGKCTGGAVGKAAGGALDGGTRPAGGRIARKGGGRAKKGMNVNIIIAPAGGGAKPPMPMPMDAPPGGPVGLHQGLPPPGAGAPMGPPAGAPMPMPMARKSGGRTKYPIDSGAGGGLGRLEKARAYG